MCRDLVYKLALLEVPGVGPSTYHELLNHYGSAEEVLGATTKDLLKYGFPRKHISGLPFDDLVSNAHKEIEKCNKLNIDIIEREDENYPYRLKTLPHAPPYLFKKGKASLNERRTLGIVGTRMCSEEGRLFCQKIVHDLREYNPVIVSGLAYGIDISAHTQALKSSLTTIAVVGTGFSSIYPLAHKSVAKNIEQNGCIVSQFRFDKGPEREHFPMRNHTMAALCDAVIVIESSATGGSMITAQFAKDLKKILFAVPGFPGRPESEGTNKLLSEQTAIFVNKADDIAREMNWTPIHKEDKQLQLFVELSPQESLLIEKIRNKKEIQLELIALEMDLPITAISSDLLQLEFKGLIKSLPGSRYMYIG